MAVVSEQRLPVSSKDRPSILARVVGVKTNYQARQAMWGYFFALPWIIGLLIFWGGPIVASAYFSFTNYEIIGTTRWLGLANYVRAFTTDSLFWPSLGRTFTFAVFFVPASVGGALLLAAMLNQKLKGTNIYRTVFFIPHLIPAVALAVLWTYLLQPRFGPINMFLRDLGIDSPPNWLTSRDSALYSVILINVWAAVGGNTMLIFLAGLQGVPQELYEAGDIDGASAWTKFRHITIPLLTPTIFFNLVLGVIGALKVFTTAWVATQGGPSYATWFFALHIYTEAFAYFRLGYGSALAWVLAIILMIFTYFQVQTSRRWVHYEGGD
ncbi:ABC transporter permease subunit [bacterium]|nr:ABC transporter permease subunit [bacterium]